MKKYLDDDIVMTFENEVYRYKDITDKRSVSRLCDDDEAEEFLKEEEYWRWQSRSEQHA